MESVYVTLTLALVAAVGLYVSGLISEQKSDQKKVKNQTPEVAGHNLMLAAETAMNACKSDTSIIAKIIKEDFEFLTEDIKLHYQRIDAIRAFRRLYYATKATQPAELTNWEWRLKLYDSLVGTNDPDEPEFWKMIIGELALNEGQPPEHIRETAQYKWGVD